MDAALTPPAQGATLAPLPADKRIEALDVIRGVALAGICLMNVSFFNRSIFEVQTGFPPGLQGLDYAAAFFVAYFVTGKFWTMFSLLFGMGFAVMLTRAESTGRAFLGPYMRRIAALAVFGALHHALVWGGDILLTYALSAVFLLLVLYAHWLVFAIGIALCVAGQQLPDIAPQIGGLTRTIEFAAVAALFIRCDKRWLGQPVAAWVLGAAAIVAAGVAATMWSRGSPASVPMTVTTVALLVALVLTRVREPASSRTWRIGALLWTVVFGGMLALGASRYFAEPPAGATAAANAPVDAKAAAKAAAKAQALKERAENINNDARIMSTGTYAEAVAHRAEHVPGRPLHESGFALGILAVFLIGTWFVRSGVMADTAAHLPLFRKLALFGIPLGVGLGLAGTGLATSLIPGVNDNAWLFANSMILLGSLPASIGYVGVIVLMLHSGSFLSKVRVLAPFGRMALTNYILQSVALSYIFFGYGLGYWGMGRAAQLLVALGVSAVLVVFSHVWLSFFRYGPLEWLWRAVTYLKVPPMRKDGAPAGAVPQPN